MISAPKLKILTQNTDNVAYPKNWAVIGKYTTECDRTYLLFYCGEQRCLAENVLSEYQILTELHSMNFFKNSDNYLYSSKTLFQSYGFWRALTNSNHE